MKTQASVEATQAKTQAQIGAMQAKAQASQQEAQEPDWARIAQALGAQLPN